MNLEIRFRLPNQEPRTIPVTDRVLIGTLLSNDVVIRTPGVEPIHAIIEKLGDDQYIITDLGSQAGIKVNAKSIDVECQVNIGDVITIGDVKIDVLAEGASSDEHFHTATTRGPEGIDGLSSKVANIDETVAHEDVAAKDDASTNRLVQETFLGAASEYDESEDLAEDEEAAETMMGANRSKEKVQVALNTTFVDTGSMREKMVAGAQGERTSSVKSTVQSPSGDSNRKKGRFQLFSPRSAKPSGDVLEVVSYWGDTVLDVELFHPSFKGYELATIGSSPKSHFLAGGKEDIKLHLLAQASTSGFRLRLLPDMHARIRKGGKIGEKKGKGSISLGRRDIAHVSHGPVKYFLMFVQPPALNLPKKRAKDPVVAALMAFGMAFYLAMLPLIYFTEDKRGDGFEDDIWSIVTMPDQRKPEPEVKIPKPEQKVAEVETPPPQPKPPKPEPQPPKPVEPKEPPKPPKVVERPQQTEPTPDPVPKPTQTLTRAEPRPEPPRQQQAEQPQGAGMAETGARRPDFTNPGRDRGGPQGPSEGARGGGRRQPAAGGARQGNTNADVAGVEGGAAGKASGVNLSQLGLGAGKVLNRSGPGAVRTDFRSSAGGAGGGQGSASKTYGLGGPGEGRTLGVAGAGGAANNFGGFGGEGSGAGGTGGLGGEGIGGGFGRRGGTGRAEVVVPPGDPVISGGLTMQEVQAVIRANLNQIRHCYEQLLQRSPNTSGKVQVNFTVNANGRVGNAAVTESTINDSVLRSCITGRIRRWQFPNPRGGQAVTVNYPFVFNPL